MVASVLSHNALAPVGAKSWRLQASWGPRAMREGQDHGEEARSHTGGFIDGGCEL